MFFIDSEPETWNLCPVALEIAIDRIAKEKHQKQYRVDLYGVPYKTEEVRTIADRYSIPILEDSAEALGSHYKGKSVEHLEILVLFQRVVKLLQLRGRLL
jgi:dTDP-4-amino-4,6-dideoxygalactose transaminase